MWITTKKVKFLLHNILPHNIAHAPCGLQVEAASDSVDVEHFACEEEVGADAAFKRVHVYR